MELLGNVGGAMLRGGGFLVLSYLLGTRLVPPLLAIVARLGSRELFILTIFAIAVGMSVLGHVAGISFALGAFMGGLVVSESEFSHEVLDEIIPMRDLFSTLFFVSIGMLLDPGFLATHVLQISILVAGNHRGQVRDRLRGCALARLQCRECAACILAPCANR